MKLYYSPGACSLASRIAFHELGQAADYERVDLKSKQTEHGRDFRAINPLGYVPALELDDGVVVIENSAILPFIADLRPGTIAPQPASRDRVFLNEALGFLSGELHKSFSPFFAGIEGAEREKALAKLGSRVDHVERRLADGREFLLGAEFTVADAYAFVILSWTKPLDLPLHKWPNVARFVERVASRAAVQSALRDEGLLEATAQ